MYCFICSNYVQKCKNIERRSSIQVNLVFSFQKFEGLLQKGLWSVVSSVPKTTCLFLIDLNNVILFHLKSFGRLIVVNSAAIEQEPQGGHGYTHALGVGLLELAHVGGHFDPEVDLVGVLAHDFELDVLGLILVVGHVWRLFWS